MYSYHTNGSNGRINKDENTSTITYNFEKNDPTKIVQNFSFMVRAMLSHRSGNEVFEKWRTSAEPKLMSFKQFSFKKFLCLAVERG